MRGLAAAFDGVLRGLLLFLIMGAPMALGTVAGWPLALFQWLCFVLAIVWVLRSIWVAPFAPGEAFRGAPAGGGRTPARSLFGHPLVSTGLGLPVALFLALILFQMAPLPQGLIGLLSPATARLHSESLPGVAERGRSDFALTGSFLAGEAGDPIVRGILDAAGEAPAAFDVEGSGLRSLSLYPYATAGRLTLLVALCCLFVVALHLFTTPGRIQALLRWIVLFGFALALFGIVQRLSWNGKIFWTIPVDPAASPFGPFINHNHFAAFIAMIVPVAVGMLMDEARRLLPRGGGLFRGQGPEPASRLVLAAFVPAVMASAVALASSRGAVLSLLAAFSVHGAALALRGRIGRPEFLAAALLVIVVMGLSIWLGLGPLAGKLRAIGDGESEPSVHTRLLGFRGTLQLVAAYPLVGTGLGTFPQAWRQVYPPGTYAVWHEAHNDYLQLLAEAGVAGFALFGVALWIFARRYVLPGLLGAVEMGSYAQQGVLVGILVVALHSLVDYPLQIPACAALFVVLSAAVISWRTHMEVRA